MATAAGVLQPSASAKNEKHHRIKAVAIDAFVIFDPRGLTKQAEESFPGRGTEFTNLWRTTQFQYTWLRTIGGRYKDFGQVIQDALEYTATTMQLELTQAQRQDFLNMYRTLPLWPDVSETLEEIRSRGIRLAFLSNFSAAMLDSNLASAKLKGYFEPHLTTDLVKAFKPSPLAYGMGPNGFGLERDEIAFAAFGGWDAVGAKWFGYPTVWVNRTKVNLERLDAQPDAIVTNLKGVLDFVNAS
jgi:2-haloacid dehalogenase